MAKALQCPNCGAKKRIDDLAGSETFQCEGCGQVTKVPPGLHDDHRAATSRGAERDPSPAEVASRDGAPPVPKRRARAAASTARVPVAAASPSAPISPTPIAAGVAVVAPPLIVGPAGRRRSPSDDAVGETRPAKVYWRILAWLIALPIALAAVGIPARAAGYLNSQRLLDVIVKHNLTRFVPIVLIVVLWALVSALLVTVMVAVGERIAARRRARRAAGGEPALA